ncbi:hypothetical protein THASP1DRAFT_22799 [Thamnocephalis sphaerospora]|uniref:Uncharacterized protein n=1 Tax=Thamnocephalis sphaerospora TaxID=78915 RepID=A0A4P9XT76_9FUNG|nr:hypothetical protein THASP1DRAFT_22799 [Thamnocephalis sphaerospora]|eukprot:RKP09357.1 hypothetical protein THASP1DRAFT_22799 [Thamnocephalis sphaerospora]
MHATMRESSKEATSLSSFTRYQCPLLRLNMLFPNFTRAAIAATRTGVERTTRSRMRAVSVSVPLAHFKALCLRRMHVRAPSPPAETESLARPRVQAPLFSQQSEECRRPGSFYAHSPCASSSSSSLSSLSMLVSAKPKLTLRRHTMFMLRQNRPRALSTPILPATQYQ